MTTAPATIVFLVKPDFDDGFTAHALDHAIFIEGNSLEQLESEASDAVHCHFDAINPPARIELRFDTDQPRPA